VSLILKLKISFIVACVQLIVTTFIALAYAVEFDILIFLRPFSYTFLITFILISVILSILKYLRQKYPWTNAPFRRLLLEILLTNIPAIILNNILNLAVAFIFYGGVDIVFASILFHSITAVVYTSIFVLIFEGVYLKRKWVESLLHKQKEEEENERKEKEYIESQYATLKSQLNPHFLFNNLTVLSSIIGKEPEIAKKFLEEFLKVYEYVLTTSDKQLAKVENEVRFIYSYFELQKKRLGARFTFEININDADLSKFIPPLSLQQLVENAFKHNIATEKQLLAIEIYSNGQSINVKNKLQKKVEVVGSTGVGLANINETYKLLSGTFPKIISAGGYFSVELPLLDKKPVLISS